MLGPLQFDSASVNVGTTFKPVQAALDKNFGDQVIRVSAQSTGSSGTATILLALVRGTTVIGYERATATVGTVRSGSDGASGNYLAEVVFDSSGTDKADLLGQGANGSFPAKFGTSLDASDPADRWFIGVTAFGTISDVTLYYDVSQKV